MNQEDFLDARGDELFSSTAGVRQPKDVLHVDVTALNTEARHALSMAMRNAERRVPGPGARISLVLGQQGSGKTHLVTAVVNQETSKAHSRIFPVVIQLTAPIQKPEYESWLLQAIVRSLGESNFVFPTGEQTTPLQRLSRQLLDRVDTQLADSFRVAMESDEPEAQYRAALTVGRALRAHALAALDEATPGHGFFAAVVLAGAGHWPAAVYLRTGQESRLPASFELEPVVSSVDRVRMILDLATVMSLVEASLVLAFDQIEAQIELSSKEIFLHSLVQGTRLAEAASNVAVIFSIVRNQFDLYVGQAGALNEGDVHRIALEPPTTSILPRPSAELVRRVVARRMNVFAERMAVEHPRDSLDPIPDWLVEELVSSRSVRLALRTVADFREKGQLLRRLPTREEFVPDDDPPVDPPPPEPAVDFDKRWADHKDASAALVQVSDLQKIALLGWFAETAQAATRSPFTVAASHRQLTDPAETRIADVVVRNAEGQPVMRKAVALCDAPNQAHRLAKQIEGFLKTDPHYPYVVRSKSFPKSATSQPAAALRELAALQGHRIELDEERWHLLHEARDFDRIMKGAPGFDDWRRERRWLSKLIPELEVLLEVPDGGSNEDAERTAPDESGSTDDGAFPLLLGHDEHRNEVLWDPYRPDPDRLNNFGFLVTGDPGSGKTQTIKVIVDAASQNDLPLCIFDFKRDYCDEAFTAEQGIEVVDIAARGLPFNPLQPPPQSSDEVKPIAHAYELAGMMRRVFSLGPVQEGTLRDAIAEVYEDAGISPRTLVRPQTTDWPVFAQVVDVLREGGSANAALVNKLSALVDLDLVPRAHDRSRDFAQLMDKRVDLLLSEIAGDDHIKAAIAEMIIIQLHAYALRGEHPRRLRRLVVFDEAHRVAHSTKLQQLAREGRAFGVGTVIGTQFPGDIPGQTAGNLATRLFLMNNQAKDRQAVVKQVFGGISGKEPRALLERLGGLGQLQGLYDNIHYGSVFVDVHPYYKRVEERHAGAAGA